MTDANLAGDHELPTAFAGTVDAAPRLPRRRRRTGLWLSILAVVLVAGAAAGGHAWANLRYDAAVEQWSEAATQVTIAQDALTKEIARHDALAATASQLLDADGGQITPAATRESLEEDLSQASEHLTEARMLVTRSLPRTPAKPSWPWELVAGADAFDDDLPALRARTAELRGTDAALGSDLVSAAIRERFVPESVDAVEKFEAGHLSALNADVIELRLARDALSKALRQSDDEIVAAYLHLNDAAAVAAASHEKVLASKAGPLRAKRLQVEAWARSIAGGVLLDFEWKRIVNNRGLNGSAGGLATWNAAHGGFSTITLSNSVAERWPSAVMKALVAHEVGHAISAKCYDMFDWQDRDANEQWATAWALSRGHTADGNGVALYGYPPKSLIEKAKTCR